MRRINRMNGVDKACRIHARRLKKSKGPSRSTRGSSTPMREHFRIKSLIPKKRHYLWTKKW